MDMQKFGAELIETSAEIGLVVGRQFIFLMRPNLVEHASEIDKAADFCRWAAHAQLVHLLSILRIRSSASSLNPVQDNAVNAWCQLASRPRAHSCYRLFVFLNDGCSRCESGGR